MRRYPIDREQLRDYELAYAPRPCKCGHPDSEHRTGDFEVLECQKCGCQRFEAQPRDRSPLDRIIVQNMARRAK